VVDTSVLAQGFVEDPETRRVYTLMRMVTKDKTVILHIPEFCLIECTNVLWKQAKQHGETPAAVKRMLADLRGFPLDVHAAMGLLPRALDIALQPGLAVYDCMHLALAEILAYPLITVDKKQAQIAIAIGVTLKAITDFPEYTSP
jgi:predicted nucleic acid-binding protein